MNNLAVLENKQASIWESETDLAQIKEIYGKGLSAGEFNTLVQMGRATGLNPFLREIWAVKYGSSAANIFIGRDGYRKSAQRHPLYDYHMSDAVYSEDEFYVVDGEIKHKYNLKNRGQLLGAYCIVKRKGSSRPSYVFVELAEYSTGQSLWKKAGAEKGKPATMIKKVAEAQGLKSAFQELFAGTYSEYEQYEETSDVASGTRPGKGVQGLKAKLGLKKIDPEQYPHPPIVDEETGEIFEAVVEPEIIPLEPESGGDTLQTIQFLMDSASSIKELMEAMKMAKDLPASEKKQVSAWFNERQAALKG